MNPTAREQKKSKFGCLKNEHVFFLCTGPSKDPGVQNKLNVHAPRDGTAAGRHGGAAREHLICS